jgi:uncharacterized membrane protein YhaH (DUF805 family)|tara:strand:+ start:154 stop:540 length:387 start_codon:yes stop_codon:yes gene_type:complete
MEWYLKVMKENFSNFSGRARRKEYWMFALIYMIVIIIAMVLDGALGLGFDMGYGVTAPYGWIYSIVALVHLIPAWGVLVRRLHDVGKSGWFMLISLVPIIGGIWLLVLLCTDGDSSENAYGPSPKSVE